MVPCSLPVLSSHDLNATIDAVNLELRAAWQRQNRTNTSHKSTQSHKYHQISSTIIKYHQISISHINKKLKLVSTKNLCVVVSYVYILIASSSGRIFVAGSRLDEVFLATISGRFLDKGVGKWCKCPNWNLTPTIFLTLTLTYRRFQSCTCLLRPSYFGDRISNHFLIWWCAKSPGVGSWWPTPVDFLDAIKSSWLTIG